MCFGCCDDQNSGAVWQSTQPNHGYVEDRPIYDNTMGQTVITQPSYGYGGGMDTQISTQPSYGGGWGGGMDAQISSQPSYGYGGGGMTQEIQTSPSRY